MEEVERSRSKLAKVAQLHATQQRLLASLAADADNEPLLAQVGAVLAWSRLRVALICMADILTTFSLSLAPQPYCACCLCACRSVSSAD